MARSKGLFMKLAQGFPEHPKVLGLSDGAFRLYVEALCYCGRYLTDGALAGPVVARMGKARHVDELVQAGLWERCDEGGWRVHDYLEVQQSREQVESKSRVRAEAGRKGGEAKARQAATKLPSKPDPEVQNTDTDTPPTPPGFETAPIDQAGVWGEALEQLVAREWSTTDQTRVRDFGAWSASVRDRLAGEHVDRAAALCREYPAITGSQLAGALTGDGRVLALLERRPCSNPDCDGGLLEVDAGNYVPCPSCRVRQEIPA